MVKTAVGRIIENANQAIKKEKEKAAAKVFYSDRLSRVQTALLELEDYRPASDALMLQARQAVEEAERILKQTPQAWTEALESLKSFSATHAVKQAQDLWDKAAKSARSKAKPLFTSVDELREESGRSQNLLTDAAIERLLDRIQEVERKLLATQVGPQDIEVAEEKIASIRLDLTDLRNSARQSRSQATTSRSQADELLDELQADSPSGRLATDSQLAGLLRIRHDADTAFAIREFADAKELLDDLIERAGLIRDEATSQRLQWELRSRELQALTGRAKELNANAKSPEVKSRAAAIHERLVDAAASVPGKGISYLDVFDLLDGAAELLVEIREEDESYRQFVSEREQAARTIEQAVDKTMESFQRLHQAVTKASPESPPDVADGPFRARLDKLLQAWSARLQSAYDVDSLGLESTTTALADLREEILAAASSQKLAERIDEGRLFAAQEQYRTALKLAEQAAERLAEFDSETGAEQLEAVAQVEARTGPESNSEAYAQATEELQELELAAKRKTDEQRQTVARLQKELEKLLSPIGDGLDGLLEAVQKMSSEEKRQPHASMHSTLLSSFDTLRALGKSSQLALLNEAIEEARTLAGDAAQALAMAQGKNPPEGATPLTFKQAAKRLGKVKDAIRKHKDASIYMKVSLFDLEEAIADAEKSFGTITMSALDKRLKQIEQRWLLLTGQVERAKALFESFENEVKQVRERVKRPPFSEAPNYAKSLEGRLDTILSNARFEGGLSDADRRLEEFQAELNVVDSGPKDDSGVPLQLYAAESTTMESIRAKEVEQSRYEAELKVVEKQIAGLKGLYPDDKQGLELGLKGAKSMAKQGNFDDARDQLLALRNRLMLLAQNPRGLAVHVRKQLPACNRRFREAVSKFSDGVGKLKEKLNELPSNDLGDGDKQTVAKTLASVRSLFNPAAFTKPLQTMANEALDESERSAAREVALRDVRRMLAYLNQDYRLQTLARNPLDRTLPSLLSELNLALLDLENNVLVSM